MIVFKQWNFEHSNKTDDEYDGSDGDFRGFLISRNFILHCHFIVYLVNFRRLEGSEVKHYTH